MPTNSCPQLETPNQAIRESNDNKDEWATEETVRIKFHHMTIPKPNDSINDLKRKESVTIFRLRNTCSTGFRLKEIWGHTGPSLSTLPMSR